MEKEEETTRELLLPNWQGSGSHGLTIAQRDDGVFVQEVVQNSPAARTGVVKEGESPRGVGWGLGWGGRGWWREGQGAGRRGHVAVEGLVPVPAGWSAPKPYLLLPALCPSRAPSPWGRRSREAGRRHGPQFNSTTRELLPLWATQLTCLSLRVLSWTVVPPHRPGMACVKCVS